MIDSLAIRNLPFGLRQVRHSNFVIRHCPAPHDATGRFDFVLANPPFNVNAVDKEWLKDSVGPGRRFPFGLPRTDNATATRASAKATLAKPDRRSVGETELPYLWIQLFHSALNEKGRAGFVMANSASDARSSEQELRRQLIESRAVDVMVAVGPNMFYTVALPCTLWFFDKAKARGLQAASTSASPTTSKKSDASLSATVKRDESRAPDRADQVLFIDARHIYRQVDRAHREWTPAQIGFLANFVRLYRGEALDFNLGSDEARAKLEEIFGQGSAGGSPAGFTGPPKPSLGRTKALGGPPNAASGPDALPIQYRDVPGLCRAATLKEIEAQGWSLNPGRYVGVAAGEAVSDEDFKEQLEALNEELETLNAQARDREQSIAGNVAEILEA